MKLETIARKHNLTPAKAEELFGGFLEIADGLGLDPADLLELTSSLMRAFDPNKLQIFAHNDAVGQFVADCDPNLLCEALENDKLVSEAYFAELQLSAAAEMPIDESDERIIDRMALMDVEDLPKYFGPLTLALVARYWKKKCHDECDATSKLERKLADAFK